MLSQHEQAKELVSLSRGSGGGMSHALISKLIVPTFDNRELNRPADAASRDVDKSRIAFTTDAHVVDPLFFPGGDLGALAVTGDTKVVPRGKADKLFVIT